MKPNKLTITESIIGWLVDLYVQMSSTAKDKKSSGLSSDVMLKKRS